MSNKKDIYIFIIYPWKKEQKEIIFKDKKNLIQNIHSEKNYEKDHLNFKIYYEKKRRRQKNRHKKIQKRKS